MSLAGAVLLHLLGYALVDWSFRRSGLERLVERMGLRGRLAPAFLAAALCLVCSPMLTWTEIPTQRDGAPLRMFATGLGLLLSWNAATRDFDPTQVKRDRLHVEYGLRGLLLWAAVCTWFSPVFCLLTAFLLSHVFQFWLHHATFPMRGLQACSAHLVVAAGVMPLEQALGLGHEASLALAPAFVLFLIILQISHYFITALAKILLGPRWYSWVLDNQLHHLSASAYSWGWARFFPKETFLRIIDGVKSTEKLLQPLAFGLELLCPLAFLDARLAFAFSAGFALFHCGVFLFSGLLFWDWILTDLLVCALLLSAQEALVLEAFGPLAFCLGLVTLAVFPLRHKLWKPMPLGWYDTPLTARIHWEVVGRSGAVYEVPNSFMCPHERLYGRVNGCFFAPHPVLSYHLGEVWKPDLRQAILKAGPLQVSLSEVRARYGILPRSPDLQDRHLRYLQAFFCALNHDAPKNALPRGLRWLKAPGDQIFYWGRRPSYRRQEPVVEVRLRFIEEYFSDRDWVSLSDIEVARVSVPEQMPCKVRPELTPKELDQFLLTHADGRLVDLPGSKKRYTEILSEV